MLEPTWNPTATGTPRARVTHVRTKTASPGLNGLLYAAPYLVAAFWMVVTLTAVLYWTATGHRELLDGCRSDAVLTGAGALVALATLVASVRAGGRSRRR